MVQNTEHCQLVKFYDNAFTSTSFVIVVLAFSLPSNLKIIPNLEICFRGSRRAKEDKA